MNILLAAMALALVPSSAAAAADCARYDKTVTLSGTATLRTFFGPPNFGEDPDTDSRVTQAILTLDRPLCVHASKEEDAVRGEREITLVPSGKMSLRFLDKKRLRVTGSLYHGFNGHHNTPILIQLSAMPEVLR